ncbi:uncharacterized protein EDB91DRAFT_1328492 [Suillus paluster]|uniref:uncharacterized protein n=1 Tax=Suillus paluster TaxID=48578 RepID=UPI001B879716|nr:uncharacterized protein EDB91DRAFT_1328492 [Suillus paluster]KAG1743164.1 hypothetical protein EDB91DRAFT_1328492 [Suillus paluster]
MTTNEQLLGLGTPCSYPHCSLLDFLPFKCPHCPDSPSFCAEHFHPHCTTAHANLDRVAPNCPLCSVPVAIPPGEDPNVRMERHISRFCEAMNATGRQRGKGGSKICARGKCGKVLFAPIGCDKCQKEFCPQHRFPKDHTCPSLTSASKPSLRPSPVSVTPSSSSAKSAPLPSSKPTLPLSSKLSIPVSLSVPNVFSKTDRRAKEERESRRKAMTDRAKRGLLTEEEKLILAQQEAARAQEQERRKGDKECLVM